MGYKNLLFLTKPIMESLGPKVSESSTTQIKPFVLGVDFEAFQSEQNKDLKQKLQRKFAMHCWNSDNYKTTLNKLINCLSLTYFFTGAANKCELIENTTVIRHFTSAASNLKYVRQKYTYFIENINRPIKDDERVNKKLKDDVNTTFENMTKQRDLLIEANKNISSIFSSQSVPADWFPDKELTTLFKNFQQLPIPMHGFEVDIPEPNEVCCVLKNIFRIMIPGQKLEFYRSLDNFTFNLTEVEKDIIEKLTKKTLDTMVEIAYFFKYC